MITLIKNKAVERCDANIWSKIAFPKSSIPLSADNMNRHVSDIFFNWNKKKIKFLFERLNENITLLESRIELIEFESGIMILKRQLSLDEFKL